jgi:hypothetical protein
MLRNIRPRLHSELPECSYLRIKAIIEMALSFFKNISVSLEPRGNFLSPCLYAAFYRLFCLWVLLSTAGWERFIQNRGLTTVVRKPKKGGKKKTVYTLLPVDDPEVVRQEVSSKSVCMLAPQLSLYIRNSWRHTFVVPTFLENIRREFWTSVGESLFIFKTLSLYLH